MTDLFLISISGLIFVASGQHPACGGSTPGGNVPPEGGVGSGQVGSRGLVRLLSHSAMSMAQPPVKRHQQTLFATMLKPPSQEHEEVDPESSAPMAEGGTQAQEAPSLAVSQALEVAIPTDMTPFHLNVGSIKR